MILVLCTFSSFFSQAQINNGLLFDGINDYATVYPYADLNLGVQDFTIESQIKIEPKKIRGSYYTIIDNLFDNTGYLFGLTSSGNLFLTLNGNTFIDSITNGKLLLDRNCHRVAVKREQNLLTFYIDSMLTIQYNISNIEDITTPSNLLMGINSDMSTSSAFSGMLDDVRIWSIARTDLDIFNTNNVCLSGSEFGLVAQWRMDHTEDNVLFDYSVNNHPGFIFNSPTNIGAYSVENTCGSKCPELIIPRQASATCIPSTIPSYCNQLNMICNGDFEQGAPIPGTNPNSFGGCVGGSSNEVTNWCLSNGNPFYFGRTGISSNSIPTNFIVGPSSTNPASLQCPSIDTWSGASAGNDRYAVLPLPCGIKTSLITPILDGHFYTIRFKALTITPNGFPQTPGIIKFELWGNFNFPTTPVQSFTQSIANGCGWNTYSINFKATSGVNFSSIALKTTTITTTQPNFCFVDDFELFEDVNSYPVIATGSGSQRPKQLDVDLSNNTYIAGYGFNQVNWGSGTANATTTGTPSTVSGYLASYDECGDLRWAKGLATSNYQSVSYNSSNNLLYVGTSGSPGNISTYNPLTGLIVSSIYSLPTSAGEIQKTIFDNSNRYLFVLTFFTATTGLSQSSISRYDLLSPLVISVNPRVIIQSPGLPVVDFDIININTVCFIYAENPTVAPYYSVGIQEKNIVTNTPLRYWKVKANNVNSWDAGIVFPTSIKTDNFGNIAVGGYFYNSALHWSFKATPTGFPTAFAPLFGSMTSLNCTSPSVTEYGWSAIINGSNTMNMGTYFGDCGISRTTCIGLTNDNSFVFSGLYTNWGNTPSTNLPFPLPVNNARDLITYKQNISNSSATWLTCALGVSSTSLGVWPTYIKAGVNDKIFNSGFTYNNLDFQQGDIIVPTGCDNTWIANLIDVGNSAQYLRESNALISNNFKADGFVIGKQFNNSLEISNYLKDENQQLILRVDMYGHEQSFSNNNRLINCYLTSGLYIAKVKDLKGNLNTMKIVIANLNTY